MESRYCKYCGREIPETMRVDAIFCSAKCGWRYRNEKRRKYLAEKKKIHQPFSENIKIIHDLIKRGITSVSHGTLEEIGFDTNLYTRIGEVDHANNSTEFIYDNFSLVLHNKMFNIKKLT